jgi:SAM-dependent methyltransferase
MNDEIKKNLIVTYDKYARDRYQAKHADWKLAEKEKFYILLKENKSKLILDLGAGPARDAPYFRDKGLNIICIDLSKEMIGICAEHDLLSSVMDIECLGVIDDSFDAVWAMNSLLHIPKDNIENILSDIKRILKPGGVFYLGMYGGHDFEGIWEDDFYTPKRFFSFYTDDDLKKLVLSHFNIIEFNKISLENRETDFQSVISRKGKK